MTEPQPGPEQMYPAAHPHGYPIPYYYPPPRPTNGLAIAAMVVSIVTMMSCPCPLGIIGALMGHAARRQIRERGESGEGMATAGIVVGWISMGLAVLVLVIYAGIFLTIGLTGGFDDPNSPTY